MSFRIERNVITHTRHANGHVSTNFSAKFVAQFDTVEQCRAYLTCMAYPEECVIIDLDTHRVIGDVPYGC